MWWGSIPALHIILVWTWLSFIRLVSWQELLKLVLSGLKSDFVVSLSRLLLRVGHSKKKAFNA